jgi:hypothetical protein
VLKIIVKLGVTVKPKQSGGRPGLDERLIYEMGN